MGSELVRARSQRTALHRQPTSGGSTGHAAGVGTARLPRAHRPTLMVGAVDHPLEREADRAAAWALSTLRGAPEDDPICHEVSRRGASRIRRSTARPPAVGAAGGPVDPALESRIRRAETGGAPLPAATRTSFED